MAEEHDDHEVHAPGPHDDEHDVHGPKAVLDPKTADKLNKGHKEEIVLAVIGILIAVYFFFRSSSSGSSSSTTATPVGTAQPVTTSGGGSSGSGSSGGGLSSEIAHLVSLQTQQANALRTANHNASAAQATTTSEIAKLTAELQKLSATQTTPASGTGTGTTGASSKEGYVPATITSGGYVSQNMNSAAQDTGAAAGVTVGQAETQAATTNATNAATAEAAYTQQQQQHPGQYYYNGAYYPIGG
jgi:hypothetical protein